MSSPKLKAQDIFNKMLFCYQGHIDEYTAKQCALIAVDEIIKSDMLIDEDTYVMTPSYLQYWLQVKREIEKL